MPVKNHFIFTYLKIILSAKVKAKQKDNMKILYYLWWFNENGPQSLIYLMNVWSTVGSTVWEGLKGVVLLGEECYRAWDLMFQKLRPLTMSLSLCLTCQLGHNLSVTMQAPHLSDCYCVSCHFGNGLPFGNKESQIKCFLF